MKSSMTFFFEAWMITSCILGLLLGAWGGIVFGKKHDDRKMRYKELEKRKENDGKL